MLVWAALQTNLGAYAYFYEKISYNQEAERQALTCGTSF